MGPPAPPTLPTVASSLSETVFRALGCMVLCVLIAGVVLFFVPECETASRTTVSNMRGWGEGKKHLS